MMIHHGDTEDTEMGLKNNTENDKTPGSNLYFSVPSSVFFLRDFRASVVRFPLN
jgi:hypothetical protein